MHIADGVLSGPMMAGTGVLGAAGVAVGLRKLGHSDIPRVAMVAAVFFVASLVHVPVGPASAHLVLVGLTGLLLGWRSFPAIGAAVLLQTVLFGYGGLTAWGANVVNMALPAVLCRVLFDHGFGRARRDGLQVACGAVLGGLGIVFSGVMVAGTLLLCGREFLGVATAILLGHIPVVVVESAVTGAAIAFLLRVQPGMLQRKGSA
jgi:cobalt/nickel transport system permease protein